MVATDLAVKALLERHLSSGPINLGIVDLRLGYNPGVAFSLGEGFPSWLAIAGTGLITAGLAVFVWRTAAASSWQRLVALSAILAGATANLADRFVDGRVTDYLHTGVWPTFNAADVLITVGAITLALVVLLEDSTWFGHREGSA